jgi:hypothetical protein
MAGRAALRASDADRDAVAERLREAATEGRLRTEELERRMESALAARTYGELDALVADLPGSRVLAPRSTRRQGALWMPAVAVAVAFPLAVASIVIAVLVITGVMAMWWFWLAIGWFFLGRRRSRLYYARRGELPMHGCAWHSRRMRTHPSRAFWV